MDLFYFTEALILHLLHNSPTSYNNQQWWISFTSQRENGNSSISVNIPDIIKMAKFYFLFGSWWFSVIQIFHNINVGASCNLLYISCNHVTSCVRTLGLYINRTLGHKKERHTTCKIYTRYKHKSYLERLFTYISLGVL